MDRDHFFDWDLFLLLRIQYGGGRTGIARLRAGHARTLTHWPLDTTSRRQAAELFLLRSCELSKG